MHNGEKLKESKVITIVCTITLIALLPILIYFYYVSELIYNILISITTGLVVSIITALCQYFVIKSKIKNNIFNCYFDMYKTIYVVEQKKSIFHYNVLSIYKKSMTFLDDLTKNISEYSGFVNNKKNRLYKKMNPSINPNYDDFNIKNFIKLFLPFNYKRFNKMVIPIQKKLEEILRNIDSKKFDKSFNEYKKIFKKLNM